MKGRKLLSGVLAAAMLFASTAVSFAAGADVKTAAGADVEKAVLQSAEYVHKAVKAPGVAAVGGEWTIIGLSRSSYDVPQSYYDAYYKKVEGQLVEGKGVLHERKYTEYSRVILALTAIGRDVTDVAGYNLLENLADFEAVKWQGVNGPIFALLALDCHDYEIPKVESVAVQTTRDLLIQEILSKEITTKDGTKGGFSLAGDHPDADVTGMALAALSKYGNRPEVKAACDRALAVLSSMENENGGYDSWGAVNSESIAQVLVGKAALFAENGGSKETFIVDSGKNADALLEYRLTDGSFEHVLGQGTDVMACEQGLYALTAYERVLNGKKSLYDMTDVTIAGKKLDKGVSVSLSGTAVAFTNDSGRPFIDENGRVQVPLRATMESYGCKVSWDADTKTALVKKNDISVKVPVGQNHIFAGAEKIAIDTAACIADGRTYLPIRAVLEAFGANVAWDADTKTVVVK